MRLERRGQARLLGGRQQLGAIDDAAGQGDRGRGVLRGRARRRDPQGRPDEKRCGERGARPEPPREPARGPGRPGQGFHQFEKSTVGLAASASDTVKFCFGSISEYMKRCHQRPGIVRSSVL